MGIISTIKDALKLAENGATAQVVKERLSLVQDQLELAATKMEELEKENSSLLRENRELRLELDSLKTQQNFLDLGICVLKPRPEGGYFSIPLCPSCKKPLSVLGKDKYCCAPCKYVCNSKDVDNAVRKRAAS